MRLVYVPEELTPFSLLELREVPAPFKDRLQGEVHRYNAAGQWEEALVSLETLFKAAWAEQDQSTTALVVLYKAEILRRLQHWEEALDETQRALNWLRLEVTQVAAYNRAVALYFAGLIHFVLRADGKVIRAFTDAQEILAASERYWSFEDNLERVAACQDMTQWMTHLLELPSRVSPGEWTLIVPVYEMVNQTLVRTGVMLVTPFQVLTPHEMLPEYLPPDYTPVNIEALSFFQLRPDAHYRALKIPTVGESLPPAQAGDVLLIERISADFPTAEAALKQERDTLFVRSMDGRVLFDPYEPAPAPLVETPRVLIGGKEEEE
ncbi:MAG TPA: hypothetical protein PLH19_06430 [Anaerolineae bacterium]|nr:hypothetical protein [Anaerolineae bacterium]HQH38157.1 hypothetical protein [Anaerolineae bacterium]